MIDGWPEAWEQELMGYLLARKDTTPPELARHFRLSDAAAAYWLGCLVKSGKVRIARIESQSVNKQTSSSTDAKPLTNEEGWEQPQAMLVVSRESNTVRDGTDDGHEINSAVTSSSYIRNT